MTPPFSRFVGTVYRGHDPRWSFDPESGDGARRHGGRFNPPGTACLYASASAKTAWLEAQQAFAFKAQPMTLCAYDVDCEDMLDLTDRTVRDAVDAPLGDLGCAWESIVSAGNDPASWEIARRLRADGRAGIITPSFARGAQPDEANIVFWAWSRNLPHRVRVIDDMGRLPRNDASWR